MDVLGTDWGPALMSVVLSLQAGSEQDVSGAVAVSIRTVAGANSDDSQPHSPRCGLQPRRLPPCPACYLACSACIYHAHIDTMQQLWCMCAGCILRVLLCA